jgi:lipid A 4'-phosphatase
VAVALLFRASDADIDLQALAFSSVEPHWPYADRQPWRALHDLGTLPGLLLGVAAVAAATASFLDLRFLRWRYPALYILAFLAIGPGFVTNILGKILAGRPRPDEVVPFGGTIPFLQPFDFGTPGKGFSFLCGHCSMGFLFFAFFFLLRGWKRWVVFGVAAVFGVMLGIGRVVQAAHFPSDVLLGGTIMFTVAAALSPLARLRPAPVIPASRRRVVAVASIVSATLFAMFLFSTPVHKERTTTWVDEIRRKAATHETLYSWHAPDAPQSVRIEVERGDVVVRFVDQPEVMVIRSVVSGYGLPGADGKTHVTRRGRSIRYEHRGEFGQWEVRASFDVRLRRGGKLLEIIVTTGSGRVSSEPEQQRRE